MFFRRQFRSIVLFTLSVFICFILNYEYSFAQDEKRGDASAKRLTFLTKYIIVFFKLISGRNK
jgi:hypothetical protein